MARCIITIPYTLKKDKSIVEKICSANSVSTYIKSLVAKDIGIEAEYDVTFTSCPKELPESGWFHVGLNTNTEKVIISKLKSVPNKSEYLRMLVTDDINSTKNKSLKGLPAEISFEKYISMAQNAASQFSELSNILRANGYLTKSAECDRLAELLTAWVTYTK